MSRQHRRSAKRAAGSQGKGQGGSARGYSWPPAEHGNTLALKYGAHSQRVYEPIAQTLVAAVIEERGDLVPYRHAVEAWADAEARAALLREHLADVGMLDDGGEPREGLLKWLVQFEKRAEAGRRQLGLDPRSHAELLRQRVEAQRSAVDLEGLRERGARIVEGRAELESGDGHGDDAA
jgi:hypothetical protein